MRLIPLFALFSILSCSNKQEVKETATVKQDPIDLIAMLDTIWRAEQEPIRLRDSLMKIHGPDTEGFNIQQAIYEKNHIVKYFALINSVNFRKWIFSIDFL